MSEEIKNMKKIELHFHLDGAVALSTISKISGRTEEDLKKEMVAPEKCKNLSDYLKRFDLPLSYMQTKENLTLIAKETVDYLESQNVIYAEIRFAPMFHTKEGLTYNEIIDAVLEGLKSNENVKTNLILCMMRGFPKEDSIKTLEVAREYLGYGVCAVDIAGAEDQYPLGLYEELFKLAREKFVPFTIHAGENESYKEVDLAISLGAKRIGHGIHSNESLETQVRLKEKKVLLEMCPTSNVQTNAIKVYENHPIQFFLDHGVRVCVNTDNKTVSGITLNEEYEKLQKVFGFTMEDFKRMNIYAAEGAFLPWDEKEELKQQLN